MRSIVRVIPVMAPMLCAQTVAVLGPHAAAAAPDAAVSPTKGETPNPEGASREFELRESTTVRQAHGVKPSQIRPTKTEAALRLFVVDKENGPIEGIVICLISPEGQKYFTEATDAKGYAEVLVPIGQTYEVAYLSLGGRDVSAKVTVANKPNYNLKLTLRYSLRRIRSLDGLTPQKFVLKGVQFETGKATLTSDSFARLDTIVEYMTHKKSACIEISGHTDNVGNRQRNLKLSQRRADACRDYLVSKGIERNRIKTVGHGDKKPVASNATKEGRQQNRRIEAVER